MHPLGGPSRYSREDVTTMLFAEPIWAPSENTPLSRSIASASAVGSRRLKSPSAEKSQKAWEKGRHVEEEATALPFQRSASELGQDVAYLTEGVRALATTGHLSTRQQSEAHTVFGLRSAYLIFGGLLLLNVLVGVALGVYLAAYSSGWAWCTVVVCALLLASALRLRRGLRCDPTWLSRSLGMLWLTSAALACIVALARLPRAAGLIGDWVCDAAFSFASLCLLLVYQLLMREGMREGRLRCRGVDEEASAATLTARGCSCVHRTNRATCEHIGCWTLTVLISVPLGLISLLVIFHSIETLAFLCSTSKSLHACHADGVCIAYECTGPVHGRSIAVVANGFGADSTSYYFVREGLSAYTRTCTYDTRGTGWTTWPGNPPVFGFAADASDLKLIVDTELHLAGAVSSEATIILAGHSNGYLTSVRFHSQFAPEYARTLIFSLDGQVCTGHGISRTYEDDLQMTVGIEFPEGAARYGIAPVMPFLAGAIDVLLIFLRAQSFFAGQDVSDLPPSIVQLLPEPQQRAMANRYTMARYWEASAIIHTTWEDSYVGDGPTVAECAAASASADDFLDIPARSVCIRAADQVYCAEHVSLVQLGSYARVASARIVCFLRAHVGPGVSADPMEPACEKPSSETNETANDSKPAPAMATFAAAAAAAAAATTTSAAAAAPAAAPTVAMSAMHPRPTGLTMVNDSVHAR